VGGSYLIWELFGHDFGAAALDSSVFRSPDVVGMAEVADYGKSKPRDEVPLHISIGNEAIGYLLAAPLLLLAAYRALANKQA
jgi:hypothetical protein